MIEVYDFDKTLTYKDTLMGFFFEFSKSPVKRGRYIFAMILTKFGIMNNDELKSMGIEIFLKGKLRSEVERLATKYSKKIVTNKIYEKIDFDSKVVIVSASFEEYLRPLFPTDVEVIGSKIEYKEDKVVGLEFNCYHDRKLEALKKRGITKVNKFFTDSYSDRPLAMISDETYIVKGDKKTLCEDFDEYFNF